MVNPNPSRLEPKLASAHSKAAPVRMEGTWGSYEEIVLPNGLVTHLVRLQDDRMVHAELLYPFGSGVETPEEYGAMHFLEHVMTDNPFRFASTWERDAFNKRNGISTNASTSPSLVTAHANSLPKLALMASGDVIEGFSQAVITAKSVAKQQSIVLKELDDGVRDERDAFGINRLAGWLHPDPYYHPSIGIREVVENFSAENLQDIWRKTYGSITPELLLVGNISTELLDLWSDFTVRGKAPKDCIRAEFLRADAETQSPWPRFGSERLLVGEFPRQSGIDVTVNYKGASVTNLFPGIALASILGGDLGSRLMQVLREERGLLYSMRTGSNSGRGYGFFTQQFQAVDINRAQEILKISREVFNDFLVEGITDDDWEAYQISLERSLATTSYSAQESGFPAALRNAFRSQGRIRTPDEHYNGFKAVTRAEVMRFAEEAFAPGNSLLIVQGNTTVAEAERLLTGLP